MRSTNNDKVEKLEDKVKSLKSDLEAVQTELRQLRLASEERIPQPRIGSRVQVITGKGLYGDVLEEGTVFGTTKHRVRVAITDRVLLRAPKNVRLLQDGEKTQAKSRQKQQPSCKDNKR